jgi:hypothetical protein
MSSLEVVLYLFLLTLTRKAGLLFAQVVPEGGLSLIPPSFGDFVDCTIPYGRRG